MQVDVPDLPRHATVASSPGGSGKNSNTNGQLSEGSANYTDAGFD
jgi:hypothetical protein